MKQLQFTSLFVIPVFLRSSPESSFLRVLIESSLLIVLNSFLKSVLSIRKYLFNIMKNSSLGVPKVFKELATLRFFLTFNKLHNSYKMFG